MIHPLRMHYDKLLLVLALVALTGSLEWVRRQQAGFRSLSVDARDSRKPAAYEPPSRPAAAAAAATWPQPRAQARGEGWLYEVFTPPVLNYDATARSFALKQKESMLGEPEVKSPNRELLTVKPEVYRLQLLGYFGPPDDYLAIFQCARSADTLLARAGRRFADLELVFRSFAVRKVLVAQAESGPVYEVAALATLFDEKSRREVVLDSRMRRNEDTLVAVFHEPDSGKTYELREGDTWVEAGDEFCVARIQLEPAEVTLTRATPGSAAFEWHVVKPGTPAARRSAPLPPVETGRVAVNAQ